MVTIFKPHEVLKLIKPYLPKNPVIIEAGAFNGNDTKRLAAFWPDANIHTFEPVPELFQKMTQNTKNLPNVYRYQLALSDKNGSAPLYLAQKPQKPGIISQASSLHKPKERLKWSDMQFLNTIMVETITLDTWVQQNSIDSVDFLWLDLQGHELPVLQAAPKLLQNIKVIYTEVGFIEAYENQQPYAIIKSWLEQNGFTEIGCDFDDQKKWFFGNVIFVQYLTH